MLKLDLNGTWQMKAVMEKEWLPAAVPGSVCTALLQAGRIEEPYYRENQYEIFELFRQDYEYRREFQLSEELLDGDLLELCCDGLDTIADIHVNGKLIASTQNMHRTYRFDIRDAVQAGTNALHIVFHSAVEMVEKKQKERYLWAANGDYVVQGYPHLRKAHHMFGWDWGPKLPDCGIWRDIYIRASECATIDDVYFTQDHSVSGIVTVGIETEITRLSYKEESLAVHAELVAPDGMVSRTELELTNKGRIELAIPVEEPQLWWPNGLGEQPLYKAAIALYRGEELLEEKRFEIGLRTLTVKQDPDGWGETFEIEVNGHSIFTMGANYIPEDNIRGRHSKERTERLIRDCVDANFNCIRVWGGGFYPDDYFYELCDQYGLIVWQDHLFACAEYEMTESFTEEITREVEDNVKRIRHHASLGIWCGNNEMEQAWVDWDFPKRAKLRTDYIKQFEILLPAVTKRMDPNTFYWLASPSSGGGFEEPNAEHKGDVHYWEVWHGGKPFTEYRKHFFRFCSEFGFQSFPSLKTVEQFTEESDRNIFTPVMESHQKNPGGNGKILHGISENFLYPNSFDSLLYVSQLLQAEAMRYGVEHWRRNRGRCMGSVYWQLNDCWPVASWSSLDYYGRWKALHYSAKRFYAPLLVSAEEEGTSVAISITNDTLEKVSGELEWKLRDQNSTVIQHDKLAVQIDSLSAAVCAELDFASILNTSAKLRQHYLEFSLKVEGETVSEGTVLFVKPKHFPLQPAVLKAVLSEEADYYAIDITADAFAMYIEMDFTDADARFSDNFFHLSGGETKRIFLSKEDVSQGASLEQLRHTLTLRSLVDSY